ncbi:MAG: cytochrome C, partial [Ignavibacteriaceae bacterium]|nr:cytochrome C [Ignavibacteriaceae bacterium]
MRKLLPTAVYNPITFTGLAISAISFGLIIFLFLLEFFADDPHPYMGIIAFIILPGILIIGLLIATVGIIREKRRETLGISRKGKFPVVNLNDPKQLRMTVILSTGSLLLLLFSAFGSFKSFEYTESDSFCGTICHEVMEPEYVAYLSSPHSRVGCVKCHIGSGASWFVKAKISGAYQVYSVMFNKYSRPIPTPVHELRPA